MDTQAHLKRSHASGSKFKKQSVAPQSLSNTKAINPIKSKIRDLTRLLAHSGHLPAGVRIEKERALAGYKQDLEHALMEKHRHRMISKYHMVRFFERQKATRNLKKVKSRLAAASEGTVERDELHKAVHQAEVDLNYTLYYPLAEKYLSLFARNGQCGSASPNSDLPADRTSRQEADTQQHSMWGIVERCMRDGSLDALREGKLRSSFSANQGSMKTEKKPKKELKKKNKLQAVVKSGDQLGDGEDSDGGFFEP